MMSTVSPTLVFLDSCAYFRLELSLHPDLLKRHSGIPEYEVVVLEDVGKEHDGSRRLSDKFWWPKVEEYAVARKKHTYILTGRKQRAAMHAFQSIRAKADELGCDLSATDCRVLAAAFVSCGMAISDDVGVQAVGRALKIKVFDTLWILKMFLKRKIITSDRTIQTLEYLMEENDTGAWKKDAKAFLKQLKKR